MENIGDLTSATASIVEYLKSVGIYDFLMEDPNLYVGGSLPTYIFSQSKYNTSKDYIPNDIDIYTKNHNSSVEHMNKHLYLFHDMDACGSILNFYTNKNFKIQFITAEVDDFSQDVLSYYDCDLIAIGYHPYSQKFVFNQRFLDALFTHHHFTCDVHRSDETRQRKLEYRAKNWYNLPITFIGTNTVFNHHEYQSSTDTTLSSVMYNINPPKYLQLFHQLYRCINCHQVVSRNLICERCNDMLLHSISVCKEPYTITILGGANGFGKIMTECYQKMGCNVYKTSRTESINEKVEAFVLGQPISDDLFDCIDNSSVLILNATKTLDGDENVWNTTINTFDLSLLMDRIHTNVCGYVQFIKELFIHRINKSKLNQLSPLTVVYVDANESKYQNKMKDGKHLELNIAKSAVKQIFYTNANIFTKLSMNVFCYDPGWMSYHGVSLEKKRANSERLISPRLASVGLMWYIEHVPNGICDVSVYDYMSQVSETS